MSDTTHDTLKKKMLNAALRAGENARASVVVPVEDQVALIEGYEDALKTARKDAIHECIDDIVDEDESTFQGLIDVIRENLRTLIDQPTNNHP